MAARTVEAQHDVVAEPEQVWPIVIDVKRYPKVLRDVDAVVGCDSLVLKMGQRWQELRAGHMCDVEVVELVEGKSVTMQVTDRDNAYLVQYTLTPSSLGTRLKVELSVLSESAGLVGWAARALKGDKLERASKESLYAELEDLAKAVEERTRR